MGEIRIIGGRPLAGSVSIQGSKNAVLPMMAAALLHEGTTVLHNCPRIADVFCMEEILRELGADTFWEDHSLYLDCSKVTGSLVDQSYARRMRSSVILLGALLGRMKAGTIGYPGGCVIGQRPVDLHLQVLRSLGAEIAQTEDGVSARAGKMSGSEFRYPRRSVGATEQGILAAVCVPGVTRLLNCAAEPEILWLQRMLNEMGADIQGAGSGQIQIRGGLPLRDSEFYVPPDRIVAGTYLCASAITRGEITILNPPMDEIGAFLEVYGKMGGQYEFISGKLVADGRQATRPLSLLETEEYPGFPTDLQSPMMAVLSVADGESRICENIFEDRFKTARELVKMRASIWLDGRNAWIQGRKSLQGATVEAKELRGGAALVLAGLAAEGETIVTGSAYIERGYERICEDLAGLGGRIERYR
ncbi:MAG: UDP-N-acetylglucosamine 1-carboxyvinyltransferase [Blautia sp.]